MAIAGLFLMFFQIIDLVIGGSYFGGFGLLGAFIFLIGLTVVGRALTSRKAAWYSTFFIGIVLFVFFLVVYLMKGGMLP